MFQELHEQKDTANFLSSDDTPLYIPEMGVTRSLPPFEQADSYESTPDRLTIRLLVRSGNIVSEVPMPETERLVLGRYAANCAHQPNIDLSDFNALQLGVSRLHAIIEDHFNIFTITDLYSSNGTSLNGRRLAPNEIRFIHDGDTICLGNLVLYVQIDELLDQ